MLPGTPFLAQGWPAAAGVAQLASPPVALLVQPGMGLRSESLRLSLKQSSLHGTGGMGGLASDGTAVPGLDGTPLPPLPSVDELDLPPAPARPFAVSAALLLAAGFEVYP